jgi:hypothetical protein
MTDLRRVSIATAVLVVCAWSTGAQAQSQRCQELQKVVQQELDSASTLKTQAAKQGHAVRLGYAR